MRTWTVKAACEEAWLQYQDTALIAFREVSDAPISRRRFEESRVEQAQAVEAGRQAVELATVRYQEGKASYYEVLEAQQQLYTAENALSQIEASRRLAVVHLYKALGGGWSLKDSEWSGASAHASSYRTPGGGEHCWLKGKWNRAQLTDELALIPGHHWFALMPSDRTRFGLIAHFVSLLHLPSRALCWTVGGEHESNCSGWQPTLGHLLHGSGIRPLDGRSTAHGC